ncbi:glycosyltransferase [Pseudomonas sp. NPDC007930]|uniref:glycosyltransferase n=1 Tax=Pseudomonas sp. NPDC007930 TaxID=3364417 RepID=UPI0036E932D9
MPQIPLVSIALHVHDARHFYRSLHSALGQSHPALEVVVCDLSGDAQVAKTIAEAQAHSAVPVTHLVPKQPLNYPQDIAYVLPHLKGSYVKFLMADDWILPPLVARQVAALEAYSDAQLSVSNRWLADEDGVILPPRSRNFVLFSDDQLIMGGDLLSCFESAPLNFLGDLSAALLRKPLLDRVVPAMAAPSSELSVEFDLALYISALRHGPLALIGQNLVSERFHAARFKGVDIESRRNAERGIIANLIGKLAGERAPWPGSVRACAMPVVPLPIEAREYTELPMSRLLHIQLDTESDRVGTDCDSFAAMYQQWLQTREFSEGMRKTLPERVASWARQPQLMPIVLDRGQGPLEQTLASLQRQSYGACGVLVLSASCAEPRMEEGNIIVPLEADWAAQLNRQLIEIEGFDWFYLLEAGDVLGDHALLLLAERIATEPELCALYSDEDTLAANAEPVFKPDFNLDLARSYPYVGRAIAFSRQRFAEAGGLDGQAGDALAVDLLLRMAELWTVDCVGHVAEVLLHAGRSYTQWLSDPSVVAGHAFLIEGHLQRLGQAFHWRATPAGGFAQVRYEHPSTPQVSLMLLSQGNLASLQACLDGLLEKTAYAHLELLIGALASEPASTWEWLENLAQIGAGRIRIDRQPAGSSQGARYNALAAQASGAYLLLLSADCRIVEPAWLDELLSEVQRPEVGIAGAKLLGADGRVENAGLVLGMRGVAGSPFVGEAPTARGYLHRLTMNQNYSAVSQHCMVFKRELLGSLGDLDASPLSDHFGDLDLCLRARDAGWLVTWTPHAQVGYRTSAENIAPLRPGYFEACAEAFERWAPKLARDPAYNKNLSANSISFTLDPGLKAGWQPFAQRIRPHLLCLPINPGAVGHYRLIEPFKALENTGAVTGLVYHGVPAVIEAARMQPDTVIFQGRYSDRASEGIVSFKRYSQAFRVFELDDYLLDVPGANEHRRFLAKEIQTSLRRSVGMCDRLVVSTQPLAEVMSDMNSDIVVVPNMLPPERWLHLSGTRRHAPKPRVGWGGGTSHTGDLLMIKDVVKALAGEVHWVFFGMCPDELRPYVHEFHGQVPLDKYPAKLASLDLDLAIAPLEQHIFNDCKSNLRLLEYGACGYPVVATATRSYRGDLPVSLVGSNSTEEWVAAIRACLADPEANARQGQALREAVQRDYMLHGSALNRWRDAWLPG